MLGPKHQLDGDVSSRFPVLLQHWLSIRSKLIPSLFMHYNLELSDPQAEWTTNCWWFVMQHGVNVRLTRRHY